MQNIPAMEVLKMPNRDGTGPDGMSGCAGQGRQSGNGSGAAQAGSSKNAGNGMGRGRGGKGMGQANRMQRGNGRNGGK